MDIMNIAVYMPGLMAGLCNSCKFYNGRYLSAMFVWNSLLSTGVHYLDQKVCQEKVMYIIEIRNLWEFRSVGLVQVFSLCFCHWLHILITKYSSGFLIGYCRCFIWWMNICSLSWMIRKIDRSDGSIWVVLWMGFWWAWLSRRDYLLKYECLIVC